MATLILVCGLPGAGKTTLARRLETERQAVRLCPDEWMASLGIDARDEAARDRLESTLTDHALRLISVGVDVILEYGFWGRSERDLKRAQARSVGAQVELHVLIVPIDELWRRVAARNVAMPWGTVPISRADLFTWWGIFAPQAPDAAELGLFDTGILHEWQRPG